MLITVKTFNGHNVNDGSSYRGALLNPNGAPSAIPVYIEQAQADSQDSGTFTVDIQSKVVSIEVVNYANRYALIAQLKTWFQRGTEGDLVVTFGDDGIDHQLTCRVINLAQDADFPQYFRAILQTGTSAWRAVNETTETTWVVTGTSETQGIAVAGKDETYLSAELTAVAGPASGYLHQDIYRLPNTPGVVHGLIPWCITVNTAALIADNTNKCQINQGGGINASVTTIPYDTVTGSLPSAGSGTVDTEQISWTGKTGTTSGNLTGVTRGVGGTTAASHADNAEIKLSQMQANCNDLRMVDMNTGLEIRRWISNPNNAATKVWINRNFAKGFLLTLATSVASSGTVPYLQFTIDADTMAKLAEMPRNGIVYHGNEWFSYTDTDPVNCRLIVGQRALFGTTEEAHTAAVTFLFIQHPLLMKYGNFSVGSPSANDDAYDTYKALFNLASSSNTSWVWTASDKFYDPALPNRLGAWRLTHRALGRESYPFLVKQLAETGDAALGFRVRSFQVGSLWKDENVELSGTFYRAAGITEVSMTGDKFRSNVNWLPIAALRRSPDNVNFYDLWTEATPASAAVWTAWTHNSVSVAAGTKILQLMFAGGYPATAGGYSALEALTCTVVFDSAVIPTGAFLGATNNYPLVLTLENLTTGDAITLDYMMILGKTFVLDGELKSVTYDGINVHSAVTLDDESRSPFLRLQGGVTNTIQISGADLGQLEVDMRYYRRRL